MTIWNNKTKIQEAIIHASNKTEAIQNLGLSARSGTTRRKLNEALDKFDISTEHFPSTNWNVLYKRIQECNSIADVLRCVGLQDKGNNHKTAKKMIEQMGLDTTHFCGSNVSKHKKSNAEIFCEKSTVAQATVRSRVISDNLLDQRCASCGLFGEWNGKPITLQLEHINGISTDNRLENLTFLCPNCHSQTNTWGRKSRSMGKSD